MKKDKYYCDARSCKRNHVEGSLIYEAHSFMDHRQWFERKAAWCETCGGFQFKDMPHTKVGCPVKFRTMLGVIPNE